MLIEYTSCDNRYRPSSNVFARGRIGQRIQYTPSLAHARAAVIVF